MHQSQENDCRAVGKWSGSLEYQSAVLNTNHNFVLKRQTQIHTNYMKHRQMANANPWISDFKYKTNERIIRI